MILNFDCKIKQNHFVFKRNNLFCGSNVRLYAYQWANNASFPTKSNYTKTAERKILSAVGTVAGDPAQTQSKSQTRSKTRRLHRNQNQHQPPIPHLSCSPDIFCFPNWTLISPPLKNCHTFPARLHEPETFHL